jgi:beta-glucosidase-like glycosyl hydrolase/CubicO group peptidase (beta-lactamase class C family)
MLKFRRAMDRYFLRSVLIVGAIIMAGLFYRFIPAERLNEQGYRFRDAKTDPAFLFTPHEWVDSVLNSLTPEKRIAQLIMVAAYSNDNPKNEEEVATLVHDHGIGGLIFFQGSPYKQAVLTNHYQSLAATPLFVGMDAEWGLAMRLDSTIRYPRQMTLGAIQDDRLIFEMGRQVAAQLKRMGVHINFAPVIDINNNPYNPVINSRSFGENKDNVTRKALFYMIGLENNGILAVAKHFPGHGDTSTDSHEDLPVISHSRQRLDTMELYPYRELIYNGLSGIMTAHLQIPEVDARRKTPSSLSGILIDSLLRSKMDFKGLIFTDALNMKGITNYYKPVVAAEKAFAAGNDIMVMPGDVPDVIAHIKKLVEKGKISQVDIDNRCRRVLAAKYWAGLNRLQPVDLHNLNRDLNRPEYSLLQRKMIESSFTVLQNTNNLLPLRHLETMRVASVTFTSENDSVFSQSLGLYMPMHAFKLKGDGTDNMDSLFTEMNKYSLLIAGLHSNDLRAGKQYGISDSMLGLLDSLSARQPLVLCLFANPYVLNRFRNPNRFKSIVVCYENSPAVQDLAAQLVFGATGARGLLPVSAGTWHSLTSGIQLSALGRLKHAPPLEADMSADTLNKIRQVVEKAISQQAMPGCQVLVARKGIVVYNQAFGHHVYDGKKPVKTSDLYDLASVTKVMATTQALMKLMDEGCLDIDQKLSAYLPYLINSNKKDLVIRDILLHQSGLTEFIQFYFSTMEPVFQHQPLISRKITDANPIRIGAGQYLNRYTRFKPEIVAPVYSPAYSLHVADNMYFINSWADTVYNGIAASALKEKNKYVYSDLGFMLFKQLVDSITRLPFDAFLDSVFYRKLGAGNLCFNPLDRFGKDVIAPTEDDQLFRKQLVRGYVHDPRAAMIGGISGHAGLFGNAGDLAKMLQMMLNGGNYAGEQYLDAGTIDLFTRKYLGVAGSRRGLGFDKPEPDRSKPQNTSPDASPLSFGHTGFTGNMIWADPANDLIYIFLSNRVYPDAENTKLAEMNVRTEIQQLIYHAILAN